MNFFHFIVSIVLSIFGVTQTIQIPVSIPVQVSVAQVASDTPAVASQDAPDEAQSPTATLSVKVVPPVQVEAPMAPIIPITVYVQIPTTTPTPTSVPQQIISSPPVPMAEETPVQPAPTFTVPPAFIKNADGSLTTAHWESDIDSVSTFYLGDQNTPGDDVDAYTPMALENSEGTSFSIEFGSYYRPVFYAVVITANGQSVVKKGQVLAALPK